jgi:hypothetical protein
VNPLQVVGNKAPGGVFETRGFFLRGGSFNNATLNVRSANRNTNRPSNDNNTVGFRVASTSRQAPRLSRRNPRDGFSRSVPRCEVPSRRPVSDHQEKVRPKETLARQVW